MAFSIEVTRPDDLLRLRFEARNLRTTSSETGRVLVVEDAAQPAFLLVHFPPQAIAEGAYYEATIVNVEEDVPPPPASRPQPPPTAIEPPGLPGRVPVRIAHGSRLVFRVPAEASIPLSIEGLLDWTGLELNVNAIAAIGPIPTQEQIAGAPAIAPPAETETALELPYKLIISPTAEVLWGHRLSPFTSQGRTELWHTRMLHRGNPLSQDLTPQNPASLRAIWSEDYNSLDGRNPDGEDRDLRRAAMTPNDHHQIVVKTSAFQGYEGEIRLSLGRRLTRAGAPSSGSVDRRGTGLSSPIIGAGIELKYWVPYTPQPFYADQLILSSLGGWLRSRGRWDLVREGRARFRAEALAARDILRSLQGAERPNGALVSQRPPFALEVLKPSRDNSLLDLSEWVHEASQGRDHYVRIVYEGELLPFHHRAALVKVTERKFKEVDGLIVAHLYQRFFIVVREPERSFPITDNGMVFRNVRLTTLVTPDLAPPVPNPMGSRSFWVEVMTSTTTRARFPFHAVGTDKGGNQIDFTIPMLFLSQAAQDDTRRAVIAAYNASKTFKELAERSARVPGQSLLFAPREDGTPTDNSLLLTRSLTFAIHNEAPRLLKAEVNVPQVQQLLGSEASTTIRLYPGYVEGGLDGGSAVFAEVVTVTPKAGDPFAVVQPTTLGVQFSSDQAGGFATPNLGVSTLSRRHGPLAGKVADAVIDKFDPRTFFPKGTAALFGTFDLFSLLQGSDLSTGAPKLQTSTRDIPGGRILIASLDWEPRIDNLDLGIASFEKSAASTFLVRGRIEKPLTFDALGAPVIAEVTSSFDGTLTNFTVTLLKVISIRFIEFSFFSRSSRKPDLKVRLDPEMPLEFKGDLTFVEELRSAIPPDLFGAGPSLDLTATGVRAGFSFALPPVAVGVFALKDVSLGAALTLPFLEGRPTLDFNVSERPHPFLLAVGIFGGGGFFHLQLDTAGLKVLEASFEFGATASIDLGVASGGVLIMAGIYFRLERKETTTELAPTLTGYLRMGGYLSVLGLIKISLEFSLSFTYDGGRDKAYGRATLTVQVEIVFFSTSVELTVEKAFGGSSGDPSFGQLFPAAETWSEYAEAFA